MPFLRPVFRQKIPNFLTGTRLFVVPLLIPACLGGYYEVATGLFGLAALTDALDGHLARKWQVVSKFGEVWDPVADKLLVSTSLIVLLAADPSPILTVSCATIIGRELVVSGLRTMDPGLKVASHGKFKAVLQCLGLFLLMASHADQLGGPELRATGELTVGAAALLTLYSGGRYLQAFRMAKKP